MKRVILNPPSEVDQTIGEESRNTLVAASLPPHSTFRSWGQHILWIEPFWLLLLAPSILLRDLFWDPWLHPWLIAALFLFWPLRLLVTRRLAPPTPINRPVLLLLLWSPIGLRMSVDWERSWHMIGWIALGSALYFALLNWPPAQKHPWLLLLLITSIGLGLALIGPAILPTMPREFFTFDADIMKSKPADLFGSGETINPNVLAGSLLLPLPLLTALGIRRSWARYRWLAPLLLLPALYMAWVLLIAQSRGSYLALLIALLVVLTLRWPWSGLAFMVALLATIITVLVDGSILVLDAIGSNGSGTSLAARVEIWSKSLLALRDFWPTGIGIGTFKLVVPALYPYAVASSLQVEHAHNLLLQVGVDLGIPGLLLFCWLLVAVMRVLIHIIRRGGVLPSDEDASERASPNSRRARHTQRLIMHRRRVLRWTLAVGLFGSIVALAVHGLVDAVTWGTKLTFFPWLFYALAGLLWQQEDPGQREQAKQ